MSQSRPASKPINLAEKINEIGSDEAKLTEKSVRDLLKKCPDGLDKESRTPLMCAVINANLLVIQWVLTKHKTPDMEKEDPQKMTALAHAIYLSHEEAKGSGDQSSLKIPFKKRKEVLASLLTYISKKKFMEKLKYFSGAIDLAIKHNHPCYQEISTAMMSELNNEKHKKDVIQFFKKCLIAAVQHNRTEIIRSILKTFQFEPSPETQYLLFNNIATLGLDEIALLIDKKFPLEAPEQKNSKETSLTRLIKRQKNAKQEEYAKYLDLYESCSKQKIAIQNEDISLACELPHEPIKLVHHLLINMEGLSSIKKDSVIFGILLTLQQKPCTNLDEEEEFKEYYQPIYENLVSVVSTKAIMLTLSLPRTYKETLKLILPQLGLYSAEELFIAWEKRGHDYLSLIQFAIANKMYDLHLLITYSVEQFVLQPETMIACVELLLANGSSIRYTDLELAHNFHDKRMLETLLHKSTSFSFNFFRLPESLALDVWKYPAAACRFADKKVDKLETTYLELKGHDKEKLMTPMTAILTNALREKNRNNHRKYLEPVYSLVDKIKIPDELEANKWTMALELEDEQLMDAFIKTSTKFEILKLLKVILANKNSPLFNFVLMSLPINIDTCYKCLELDDWKALNKLLISGDLKSCAINFLPATNLLAFYKKSPNATPEDFIETLNLLKTKLTLTLDDFNEVCRLRENDNILTCIIQLIKNQRSPSLLELFKIAIEDKIQIAIEILLKHGVEVTAEHLETTSYPNYGIPVFDSLAKRWIEQKEEIKDSHWERAIWNRSDFFLQYLIKHGSKNYHALRFAARNGLIPQVKILLDTFLWTPKEVLDLRKLLWEVRKIEEIRKQVPTLTRADNLLSVYNMTHEEFLKYKDDDRFDSEDIDFMDRLVRKKNVSNTDSNTTNQPVVSTEPKLENKIEIPANASAPDWKDRPKESPRNTPLVEPLATLVPPSAPEPVLEAAPVALPAAPALAPEKALLEAPKPADAKIEGEPKAAPISEIETQIEGQPNPVVSAVSNEVANSAVPAALNVAANSAVPSSESKHPAAATNILSFGLFSSSQFETQLEGQPNPKLLAAQNNNSAASSAELKQPTPITHAALVVSEKEKDRKRAMIATLLNVLPACRELWKNEDLFTKLNEFCDTQYAELTKYVEPTKYAEPINQNPPASPKI